MTPIEKLKTQIEDLLTKAKETINHPAESNSIGVRRLNEQRGKIIAYSHVIRLIENLKIVVLVILALAFSMCRKSEQSYTVRAGENQFRPIAPTLPYLSSTLEYELWLSDEWWEGDLTEPAGYGCKLYAIGKLNYHEGGANFALSYQSGKVYVHPRYYEPVGPDAEYRLFELSAFRREVLPYKIIRLKIVCGADTRFFVDGVLICTASVRITFNWLTPPFLGRSGNDNRYPGGDRPGAWATRDLTLNITRL